MMKFPILLCLLTVLINHSIATNENKEKGIAKHSKSTGLASKVGKSMSAMGKMAVVALALQHGVSPALGMRMPSATANVRPNSQEGTSMNMHQQMSYKELHAMAPLEHGIEVPRNANEENDATAMAPSPSDSIKRQRRPIVPKFDPTKVLIDPRVYPMAPRGNVTDNYNGTIVLDPYRALEDPDATATKTFVVELNKISGPYLETSPLRKKLNETLTNMWNYEVTYTPSYYGDFYYYYHNTGLQNHRVMYKTKSLNEEGVIFMDPNTFSADGSVSVSQESFSQDGQLFAYAVNEKGSQTATVKFKNCTTGNDLPDQVPGLRASELSWLNDNSGLFYSKYQTNGTSGTGALQYHSLYFHKMGTQSTQDILVARSYDQPDLEFRGYLSEDGHFLFVTVGNNGPNNKLFYYDLAAAHNVIDGPLPLKPLFDQFDAFYTVVDSDNDSVLILTNKDAPFYKVIRVSLADGKNGANAQVVIPEDTNRRTMNFIDPMDKDKLIVSYLDNVKATLSVHDLQSGQLLYDISVPLGSIEDSDVFAYKSSSKLFFKIESTVLPFIIYEADFAECPNQKTPVQLKEFRRGKVPGLDLNAFTMKQVFYTSKDGTKVPMFITLHNDTVLDGNNPLILSGYGGFDDLELPTFSVSDLMFIQHFGGITATPNIRGGGEFGEQWHEAGMREKKQNVFDDFIAAAEYLIREKYTSKKKLAIYGGSNGGLLTAVCSQQRPDLFGAVITRDGVLDMLRFNKFTVGDAWVPEYGNPENPKDFVFLYKYSPLHQLKLNLITHQQWPATLLMSADHDDLVVPAHTLKYAAQLYYLLRTEAAKWQRNPVVVQIAHDEGHKDHSLQTSQLIEEKVTILSFVQRVFGLEWIDRY